MIHNAYALNAQLAIMKLKIVATIINFQDSSVSSQFDFALEVVGFD